MSFLGEHIFEIGTPDWDGHFDGFLLLGDFGRDGSFGDGLPVKPKMSFQDVLLDFVVCVQSQALKEVV